MTTTKSTYKEKSVRALFALPGLHRVNRGAEVAFEELAKAMAALPGYQVTLIGSGPAKANLPYHYLRADCVPRERFLRWPKAPFVRTHYAYEELTYVPGLLRAYRSENYDVTVTCGYPYTNWVLRARQREGRKPVHVFVTQNGDWMVRARNWEYRHFGCDGLVCTNPEFYERHRNQWPSALIPNGVNPTVFSPGIASRTDFGLPADAKVVLMVSALIESKRVLEAIRSVARIPDAFLVVAGDGELRQAALALGRQLMPGRFQCMQLGRAAMPALYRCADVFLHMSKDESSANAYIEALATGLPIVTHDRLVTRWTLEDTGVLVDTNSESAVTAGIRLASTLVGQPYVAARRRLAETRFAWRTIASQYARFFGELLVNRSERKAMCPSLA